MSDAKAIYALIFDGDGVEAGTRVIYASGTRRIALDPRPYVKLKRRWKIPPQPWPLFDREGVQV